MGDIGEHGTHLFLLSHAEGAQIEPSAHENDGNGNDGGEDDGQQQRVHNGCFFLGLFCDFLCFP